jgi:geranylgeranyl pyrophosphate synthase
MWSLDEIQAEYGRLIDEEIASRIRPGPAHPDGLYEMMRYQLEYVDEQLLPRSRERAWPIHVLLCVTTCRVLGGSGSDAVPVAAAIELLYNAFRIHEAVEVHDEGVNGRAAVWKRWGDPQTINTGDGMYALARRAMLEATDDPELALLLARRLGETELALLQGQHLNLSLAEQNEVGADEYLHMIELKSGPIAGYSAWAGAVIGGADVETQRALHRFGSELGTALAVNEEIACGRAARAVEGMMPADRSAGGSGGMLAEGLIQQRLENALNALRQVGLGPGQRHQLETLARELVSCQTKP